jgi:hypothetical protein
LSTRPCGKMILETLFLPLNWCWLESYQWPGGQTSGGFGEPIRVSSLNSFQRTSLKPRLSSLFWPATPLSQGNTASIIPYTVSSVSSYLISIMRNQGFFEYHEYFAYHIILWVSKVYYVEDIIMSIKSIWCFLHFAGSFTPEFAWGCSLQTLCVGSSRLDSKVRPKTCRGCRQKRLRNG